MRVLFILTGIFLVWYSYFAFEYFLNSGFLGEKNRFFTTINLSKEDFLMNIPGCGKRREAFIRNMIEKDPDEGISGKHHYWSSEEIYLYDLYRVCAEDVLPGHFSFWLKIAFVSWVGSGIGNGLTMLFL